MRANTSASWNADPPFGTVLADGIRFGALAGAAFGGAVFLFEGIGGVLSGSLIGLGFGLIYGAGLAIGGWTLGRFLHRLGVTRRKGASLALGASFIAASVAVLLSVVSSSADLLTKVVFFVAPAGIAAMVATKRGRSYDDGDDGRPDEGPPDA